MVSPVKPPAEVVSAARWRFDGMGSCSREGGLMLDGVYELRRD